MNTTTQVQHDDANVFFKDANIQTGMDAPNVTLWEPIGSPAHFRAEISPTTSENAVSDWKVTLDEEGNRHNVHCGRKYDMLDMYYRDDSNPKFFMVHIRMQQPRDPKDCQATYDYVKTLPNGDKTIAAHKAAFASKGQRIMLLMPLI